MFGGSWRTGFAIGLIVGLGAALFFLVWAVPDFRDYAFAKSYYENWEAASNYGKNQNQDNSHFWVRELYGWVFAEDSLAQWLMALLGFAATAISLFALVWLKRTWDQTKRGSDAAWAAINDGREANKIAFKQYAASFRPWLTVRISGPYVDETRYPLRMFRDEDPESRYIGIEARIEVTNAVRMPATITYCHVRVRNREGWRGSETFFMIGEGEKFIPAPPNHDQRTVAQAGPAHLGHFLLTRENREEMMMAREPIIGIIRYSDPLGIDRELGFAFEPSAVWGGGFHRWGGKEYNYDREI